MFNCKACEDKGYFACIGDKTLGCELSTNLHYHMCECHEKTNQADNDKTAKAP